MLKKENHHPTSTLSTPTMVGHAKDIRKPSERVRKDLIAITLWLSVYFFNSRFPFVWEIPLPTSNINTLQIPVWIAPKFSDTFGELWVTPLEAKMHLIDLFIFTKEYYPKLAQYQLFFVFLQSLTRAMEACENNKRGWRKRIGTYYCSCSGGTKRWASRIR